MGRRIDWLDDPDAPPVNSVVPSANVIVVDERNRMLMIQRTDNGNWATPGGGHDPGESLVTTAVRETKEETGIDVEVTGLVGIYTDPGHRIEYTSDGEVRQEFSVVFTARPVDGQPTINSEASKVEWLTADEVLSKPMHSSMRMRIDHYLSGEDLPYLG